jgi:hypothetical protein
MGLAQEGSLAQSGDPWIDDRYFSAKPRSFRVDEVLINPVHNRLSRLAALLRCLSWLPEGNMVRFLVSGLTN